ncbi:protein kinase [Streptomyces sp. NPDC050418]|uniref:protein kinase domain-containing protein n=1 Tax=Streptomyces sp. NPDC050418 TaxID=3365612 RepID=UPI0037B7BBCD
MLVITGSLSVPEGYRIGPWTVGAVIGAGAFGAVYAAERAPEDTVRYEGAGSVPPVRAALKFLPTGTRTPRQLRHLRDLAEREVEVLSTVLEPRLIRMYDVLTVDDPGQPELDGATVLVLEQAASSLDVLLAGRGPVTDGPPGAAAPVAEGLVAEGPELLAQICEGLGQLHRAGWVHGDLKPGNVLLMPDGTARLADFNLAAELDGTHAYAPAFATLDYTPPELHWSQVGEQGRQIRPTADIWAFGVLAHLVLTGGRHPFPGPTPDARRDAAVRYARGKADLTLSAGLPLVWREIIGDCLARTHEERAPHDAASLLPRVREAAAGGVPVQAGRRSRRRAGVIGAVAAVVVAAVAALGLTLDDPQDNKAAPEGKPPATAKPSVPPEPVGYDRCLPGSVCFFTEPEGQGRMCAWAGDDTNWAAGEDKCSWTGSAAAKSVFNNGNTGEEFIHVRYFGAEELKDRLGCAPVGERKDFAEPVRVRSHTWASKC